MPWHCKSSARVQRLDMPLAYNEASRRPLQFDGFNSLFLYRRLYRCYTSLNGFSFDNGNVERMENLSLEEFHKEYDGKKPVLINGLADNWPARKSWTSEQLLLKYPDTKFRISQRSSKKINMKFKDYSSYMQIQHDEDPLYIFYDKGACLALNAGKWYERVREVCAFYEFPSPLHDEKLPVGTGSNPVYLIDDYAIKIFAEGGLEASLYGLGTELEFLNVLHNLNSSLKNYIPSVLASGILLLKNGSYKVLPWDGRGIPEVVASSNLISIKHKEVDHPFGVWGKKQFEYQTAGKPLHESGSCGKSYSMWPYIVTKRCRGKIFAELCYCILHDENVLGAIFSLWTELRTATSWEEVEEKVWGDLNDYTGSC
ncbi:UNVERIFIED_CONTAM: F-box protein [Sesamum radiatum]|uniref:F-box protein n=1 Tax=Sesamum radiatum TaxID=300843 RepID=A0AAW2SIX3_SESRA